jgi:hypothetical protein
MRITLLSANEFGALTGNDLGQVTFLDGGLLCKRDTPDWEMPVATGQNTLGVILPDIKDRAKDRHIDYLHYSQEDVGLSVKAAFDPVNKLWYAPELPTLPPVWRIA